MRTAGELIFTQFRFPLNSFSAFLIFFSAPSALKFVTQFQ
jgi:hypothetical protein